MPSRARRAIWASALAVGVVQVAGSFGAASNQPERSGIDALAIVLLLAGPIALAVRDRWPVVAVAVSIAAVDVWIALGYAYGPIFLSPIVALFTAVLMGHRRDTWAVAALGYLGLLVASALDPNDHGDLWVAAVVVAAWLLVVLALAEVARGRRDQVVERRRAAEIERQQRLDEQRLDLAQELHDVLAHTISLINVQASVALHLFDEQPERARPALTEIKQQSSEALRELRTALDVLRRGDDAPRSPAPRLAELPALVDSVRASGLDVRFEQEGRAEPLPAATELAAYRIVQEALTNVTRHAGAHGATVRVRYDHGVHVEVVDDGRGPALGAVAPHAGRGITGMRERAASVGGTVAVGPGVHGGFRVAADLPADAGPTGRAVVTQVAAERSGAEEGGGVISVLVADDQALVRSGFRALLDSQEGIEVTGEASDGDEAVALARELHPDVVLMDIRMPGTDGLTATRRLTEDQQLSDLKVVILTTFDLDEYVFEAIRAGASGFLVKDTEPEELVRAVRAVVAGDALLSPRVTRRLIGEFASRARVPQPEDGHALDLLTEREREVVALVAEGLSNDEIAARLFVGIATVKTHVSRAMGKLAARDRAQLVVFAYESGLVRPGWQA